MGEWVVAPVKTGKELWMKEPYGEGPASHTGPESCAGSREGTGEALTGVHTGQVLSSEINCSRMPTLSPNAEGNTLQGDRSESCEGPAESKTLSMCGNSMRGNREIPEVPVQNGWTGRPEKAKCRTSGMYASGKSDGCIVPEKPSNKGNLPAETVEGRRPTKGNTSPTVVAQTQSWIVMYSPLGVRRVAGEPWRSFTGAPVYSASLPKVGAV